MAVRKKLTYILRNSNPESIKRLWENTKAAEDLKPIPGGEYRCALANGELFTAKSGTPGYKITFEVIEGEHAGRRVWHDVWFSEAALSLAKRDLSKLGVTDLQQLEHPVPEGIVVLAKVALRRHDDGTEYNRVVRFEVVANEPPEADPFAPVPVPGGEDDSQDGAACLAVDADGFDWKAGEQTI
jgi:hypothetical protein